MVGITIRFYFSPHRILGLRRAPVVVGRYVNLNTEIKPVASEQLLSTFLTIGRNYFLIQGDFLNIFYLCNAQFGLKWSGNCRRIDIFFTNLVLNLARLLGCECVWVYFEIKKYHYLPQRKISSRAIAGISLDYFCLKS